MFFLHLRGSAQAFWEHSMPIRILAREAYGGPSHTNRGSRIWKL